VVQSDRFTEGLPIVAAAVLRSPSPERTDAAAGRLHDHDEDHRDRSEYETADDDGVLSR
jgi:hypothetical protein